MTTLQNSYCVPKTVEEWSNLGMNPLPEHMGVIGTPDGIGICIGVFRDGKPRRRKNLIIDNPDDFKSCTANQIIDLLHDRIVPWRLEEVGFVNRYAGTYVLNLEHAWMNKYDGGVIVTRAIRFNAVDEQVALSGEPINITTFTDLMELIRMLTPNNTEK